VDFREWIRVSDRPKSQRELEFETANLENRELRFRIQQADHYRTDLESMMTRKIGEMDVNNRIQKGELDTARAALENFRNAGMFSLISNNREIIDRLDEIDRNRETGVNMMRTS
jgi:hypothetical protein